MKKKVLVILLMGLLFMFFLYGNCLAAGDLITTFDVRDRSGNESVTVGDFLGRVVCSVWMILSIYFCVNSYLSEPRHQKSLRKAVCISIILMVMVLLAYSLNGINAEVSYPDVFFLRLENWLFTNGIFGMILFVTFIPFCVARFCLGDFNDKKKKAILAVVIVTISTLVICLGIHYGEKKLNPILQIPIYQD